MKFEHYSLVIDQMDELRYICIDELCHVYDKLCIILLKLPKISIFKELFYEHFA